MGQVKTPIIFGLVRIAMGWIFLWAFLDKLFGFGLATESGKAWINGVSPTTGFLKFGTADKTFADFFQGLAGSPVVDWLYMIGMLGVGLALIFGVMVRFSSWVGAIIMILILAASLPLTHNPLVDEHVVYILILIALPAMNAGRSLGLGNSWKETDVVQRNKFWE